MIRLILAFALLLSTGAAAAVWEPAPTLPDSTTAHAAMRAVSHAGLVYALGGTPHDTQNNAPVFTLATGAAAWTPQIALEGAVVHVGAGVDAQGRVLVFGGLDPLNGDSGNSYVYDLVEGPWDGLASRQGAAPDTLFAVVADDLGRLYSLGGGPGAGGANSADAQRYLDASDTWETLPPLPSPCAAAAACSDGQGGLLVIGGFNADGTARTDLVQRFDLASGAWSTAVVPPLPVALSNHRAVLGADGRVYVLGGDAGPVGAAVTRAEVLVFDPATGLWSDGPAMAEPRRDFGAVLHDDDFIYVLGGRNATGGTARCERLFTPVCPAFAVQPGSTQPWDGQALHLDAALDGGAPLSYRWRRDGVDLADGPAPGGGVISGADSPSLSIAPVAPADAGVYTLLAVNDCGETESDAATVAVRTPPVLPAAWSVTELHPAGALASRALAVDGDACVGYATVPDTASGQEHAWTWSVATGAGQDIHPDPQSTKSWARGVSGDTVVGFWWHPYDVYQNGHWYRIYLPKACRWVDGAWSEIIMSATYEYTSLNAVDPSGAVGTASGDDAVGNTFSAAFLLPASGGTTFLQPSGGVSSSACNAVDDGRQFGSINTPFPGPTTHAAMWSGAASTFTDLHPAGASRSWISAADDGQQVGSAEVGGVMRSYLWYGRADDVTDLGASTGAAAGVGGGLQVGSYNPGAGAHACVWRGTPESLVDLHGFLPARFTLSFATDVDVDASGVIRIVGHAYDADAGRYEAVAWSSAPVTAVGEEPAVRTGNLLALGPARPNPFQGGTAVSFTLTRAGDARLDVLDVRGRRISARELHGLAAGAHTVRWDGKTADGREAAAGTYFLRVRAEGAVGMRRVTVVR